MTPSRLLIVDFLQIKQAEINLAHQASWFFGDNASGKSSIAEALRFVLTRTARGTDAAGRGAAALIRDGASEAQVHLDFDSGDFIGTRIKASGVDLKASFGGKQATGKAAEILIRESLGAPELLRCLADAEQVLRLDAKAQSELLSGVLGDGCTLEEFAEYARAAGLAEYVVQTLTAGVDGRLGTARLVTPAVLKDSHKAVYDLRTAANAALKKLQAAPVEPPMKGTPTPTEEEIQAARDAIAAIENAGFDLRTQHGAAFEAARAQGTLIIEEKKLQEQIKALPKAEAGEQTELAMGPSLTELETRVIVAKQAEADARTAFGDASKLLATRLAGEQALRVKAEGKPLHCDGTIGAGQPCPLAPPAKKLNPADLSIAQKLLGDAQVAEGHARTKLELSVKAHVEAVDAFTAARVAASKSAGAAEAQRSSLEEQLLTLAEKIEAAGMPVERVREFDAAILENGRTLAEAKRVLEAKEWVAKQVDAFESYRVALADAQAEADLFDALVKALEPRALPLAILSERIDPFVRTVNATLAQMVDYTCAIDTSDGLALTFTPLAGGRPRPAALLSESERLRVGAALSIALADSSGLGFVVIDRFDALTAPNRERLAAAIEGGVQAIVLGSYTEPPFGGEGVWWVEGGEVSSVEQPQEVGSGNHN